MTKVRIDQQANGKYRIYTENDNYYRLPIDENISNLDEAISIASKMQDVLDQETISLWVN